MKAVCADVVDGLDEKLITGTTLTDMKLLDYKNIQNVIYIDSEYDPNQVGAVKNSEVDPSKHQHKFLLNKSAQFAHLLNPTSCDSNNVNAVRYRVVKIVECWLNNPDAQECAPNKFNGTLPEYNTIASDTCNDVSYPWGQENNDQSTTTNPEIPQSTTSKSGDKDEKGSSAQLMIQIPLLVLCALILLM